jgi:hypothetical protein
MTEQYRGVVYMSLESSFSFPSRDFALTRIKVLPKSVESTTAAQLQRFKVPVSGFCARACMWS